MREENKTFVFHSRERLEVLLAEAKLPCQIPERSDVSTAVACEGDYEVLKVEKYDDGFADCSDEGSNSGECRSGNVSLDDQPVFQQFYDDETTRALLKEAAEEDIFKALETLPAESKLPCQCPTANDSDASTTSSEEDYVIAPPADSDFYKSFDYDDAKEPLTTTTTTTKSYLSNLLSSVSNASMDLIGLTNCSKYIQEKDRATLAVLQVRHVFDLMVETRKFKYGIPVTSSEKVDPEKLYSGFNLNSIPYPGCEFFTDYSDNGRCGDDLVYDWTKPINDAKLSLSTATDMDLSGYSNMDLVELSTNYLKLMLKTLAGDSEGGLLIHCISGWDRTPLFVSLVRLSLWADGLAHQSLDAYEIAELVIAYDWFLFGHQFRDRVHKREEIFYFGFDVLREITGAEFSLAGGDDASLAERKRRLFEVRSIVCGCYNIALRY